MKEGGHRKIREKYENHRPGWGSYKNSVLSAEKAAAE